MSAYQGCTEKCTCIDSWKESGRWNLKRAHRGKTHIINKYPSFHSERCARHKSGKNSPVERKSKDFSPFSGISEVTRVLNLTWPLFSLVGHPQGRPSAEMLIAC